jgi:hypothetical protein
MGARDAKNWLSTALGFGWFDGSYTPPAAVASDVPEPSTWAMLLIGFVGLAFVSHRRRKHSTLALTTA